METRLTLAPGQNGTKKLLAIYGDRLVCVRCRYDSARGVRYKTVELISKRCHGSRAHACRAAIPIT